MKNKKRSNRKAIIWSILGMLVVALVIIKLAVPKKLNYSEVKPTVGSLTTYYSFSGSVAAKNSQTVYASQAMQIKDIKVAEGDQVTPDTVLMTTTNGLEVKPDISGKITTIYADVNAQMMPGAKLLDIVDFSNLQLIAQVDENDLAAVSTGKEATVTINALNKEVTGKITDVSQVGTYQNGYSTFTATISLPKESDLRVGMSAQAKIKNQSVSGAVILPMSAIQFDVDNNPYVLLKNSSNMPKQVGVTLGINDGVNVVIKSGVTTNDIILIPPATTTNTGFGPGSQMRQGTNNAQQGTSGGGSGQ
ncbi:efflux RND transporter periplasmic adaptor subunit [Desulfosporosinus sp. SYSU MS00001]|uniref:efflux RND transporter periplasmic adaptor subunit n=1 Tax=Desulfosporosinus sp. SYSU MS00001 TaxID=3416284 RepID=UPI003CF94773